MTEVVLYHHVQGLTDGVRSFADELRQAGHTVHTPDLFDGRTFGTIEEGMAFARETGFGALFERGVAAAEEISPESVYAGFSMGVGSPSSSPRPGPEPVGPCSCTRAFPSRSSEMRGPRASLCRCTARRATSSSRGPPCRPRTRRLDRPGRAVPLSGGQHLFADS